MYVFGNILRIEAMKDFIKNLIYVKAWRGELSFALAFWVVQVLTSFVLLVLSGELFASEDVVFMILAPYGLYSFICIMRCAKTYKKKSLSTYSTFFIVIAYIWSLFFLISMAGVLVESLLA